LVNSVAYRFVFIDATTLPISPFDKRIRSPIFISMPLAHFKWEPPRPIPGALAARLQRRLSRAAILAATLRNNSFPRGDVRGMF